MTTRTLALMLTVIAATTGPLLAQTPAPGQAPARGDVPAQTPRARTLTPPEAPPRTLTPPDAPPRILTPSDAPPPPVAGTTAARRTAGQPVNVKIDFTITDQRGSGTAPVKRTISLIVADAHTGQIRSQSDVAGISMGVPLNVDTTPELLADNKIRVGFNLQYDWAAPVDAAGPPARGTVFKTAMHDSMSLILDSGKSMIAAQSADPIGDRQVTVEVKATILK